MNNIIKISFVLFLITFVSVGYSQNEQKKTKQKKQKNRNIVGKEFKTTSGLKYTILEQGDGVRPKQGETVVVHYTGKLTNDTVFDSSVERGQPFSFKLGVGQVIKGWDEGIALLNVGDKAKFIIPPHLAYGEKGAGGVIGPNETLIFEVELLDVKQAPKKWNLSEADTITTSSGLKYIKVNDTDGVQAEANKIVSVHYSGYLPDGSMFDSSVERGQPIAFPLGQGKVIKGWDEGIALLKVGEKAQLIIPHELGYGERGYPPVIPAKSTLIFDVELIEVK